MQSRYAANNKDQDTFCNQHIQFEYSPEFLILHMKTSVATFQPVLLMEASPTRVNTGVLQAANDCHRLYLPVSCLNDRPTHPQHRSN